MYTRSELLKMLKDLEAHEPNQVLHEPADVFTWLKEFRLLKKENFFVIGLNCQHEKIYIEIVSVGILDRTIVHPREVFQKAILEGASGIIAAHNHPSGRLEPSMEDKDLTRRLKDAGEIIAIPLMDHVIFTETGYYSFLEKGEL